MDAPQTLLGTPLTPEGTQTGRTRRVLVAPHGAGVRRTRLYLVGRGVEEGARHAVPVVDRNEAECAANLTCKGKGMFLYSTISSPLDSSKRFTLLALPGIPVHSDTNSASLVSILARQQFCAKTIHSHFSHASVERTKMLKLRNGSKGRIRTRALSIANLAFYHWATALHDR